MGCSTEGWTPTPDEIKRETKAIKDRDTRLKNTYKPELDKVTSLLCFLMTVIEKDSGDFDSFIFAHVSNTTESSIEDFKPRKEALLAWWKAHKALDEKNKIEHQANLVRSATAKLAKANLSAEEKKALGIK